MIQNNPLATVIDLRNAAIKQGNDTILNAVNMSVFQGEMVYLIGRTGSGKSSLLKTLYADLPLTDGEGTVANFDLRRLTSKEVPFLRRKLGVVFQDFNLLSDRNVEDNLAFALWATGNTKDLEIKERVYKMLEGVGLAHKGLEMPHRLSGGERQRVVIARALLNNPEILIADEPTGSLDPDTSDEVLFLLRNLCRESSTAVLIATHDYSILEKFPARTIRCHNGSLIEESFS